MHNDQDNDDNKNNTVSQKQKNGKYSQRTGKLYDQRNTPRILHNFCATKKKSFSCLLTK